MRLKCRAYKTLGILRCLTYPGKGATQLAIRLHAARDHIVLRHSPESVRSNIGSINRYREPIMRRNRESLRVRKVVFLRNCDPFIETVSYGERVTADTTCATGPS